MARNKYPIAKFNISTFLIMAPRSKRSIANQNNARKRRQINPIDYPQSETGTGDTFLDTPAVTDEAVVNENVDAYFFDNNFIEEEMYVEEVWWDDGDIAEKLNALNKTSFYSEADKNLKYSTRPGGSETLRRWKAKLKTDVRMASLLDYKFTIQAVRIAAIKRE
ncbi:hypothetical protein V1525DRAFT_417537 [Lipomyces kononenkoae]|uniref:Uncharacterized protein n=1 Tax=Lipomyces kononenkoae TaxID=34357 RepID=A0ACC3T6Q0_LIPKO